MTWRQTEQAYFETFLRPVGSKRPEVERDGLRELKQDNDIIIEYVQLREIYSGFGDV